jgi:hypothetical protein
MGYTGVIMADMTLNQIETVIAKAKPEQQRRLLARLPRLLKISAADITLLKLAEGSFDFWDNPDDAIYDQL